RIAVRGLTSALQPARHHDPPVRRRLQALAAGVTSVCFRGTSEQDAGADGHLVLEVAVRCTRVRLAIRLQSERFAGQSVNTREVILDTHADAEAAVQGPQFHTAADHRTGRFTESHTAEDEWPDPSFCDQVA